MEDFPDNYFGLFPRERNQIVCGKVCDVITKKRDVIVGAVLCFAGGSIDGYSYVMRGGVLATAQTANLLLLGINIFNGSTAKVLRYLLPILCFLVGSYIAKLLKEIIFKENTTKWQESILLIQIIVFIILGLVDATVPDFVVNAVISFFSAMQYCAFRSFWENAPYATVFSTGNMRSLVDNMYEGIMHKECNSIKRSVGYMIMLFAFAFGAFSSNLLSSIVAYRSCWLVSATLLLALCLKRGGFVDKN